jgi:hypothetical protein
MKVLMHALAASCEELRARTGNPPLASSIFHFSIVGRALVPLVFSLPSPMQVGIGFVGFVAAVSVTFRMVNLHKALNQTSDFLHLWFYFSFGQLTKLYTDSIAIWSSLISSVTYICGNAMQRRCLYNNTWQMYLSCTPHNNTALFPCSNQLPIVIIRLVDVITFFLSTHLCIDLHSITCLGHEIKVQVLLISPCRVNWFYWGFRTLYFLHHLNSNI